MIETSEGVLRWWTVFFGLKDGRGHRDVLAPSKRRAAWLVKFHARPLGVFGPGVVGSGTPTITGVVSRPRSRQRALGDRPGPVGRIRG